MKCDVIKNLENDGNDLSESDVATFIQRLKKGGITRKNLKDGTDLESVQNKSALERRRYAIDAVSTEFDCLKKSEQNVLIRGFMNALKSEKGELKCDSNGQIQVDTTGPGTIAMLYVLTGMLYKKASEIGADKTKFLGSNGEKLYNQIKQHTLATRVHGYGIKGGINPYPEDVVAVFNAIKKGEITLEKMGLDETDEMTETLTYTEISNYPTSILANKSIKDIFGVIKVAKDSNNKRHYQDGSGNVLTLPKSKLVGNVLVTINADGQGGIEYTAKNEKFQENLTVGSETHNVVAEEDKNGHITYTYNGVLLSTSISIYYPTTNPTHKISRNNDNKKFEAKEIRKDDVEVIRTTKQITTPLKTKETITFAVKKTGGVVDTNVGNVTCDKSLKDYKTKDGFVYDITVNSIDANGTVNATEVLKHREVVPILTTSLNPKPTLDGSVTIKTATDTNPDLAKLKINGQSVEDYKKQTGNTVNVTVTNWGVFIEVKEAPKGPTTIEEFTDMYNKANTAEKANTGDYRALIVNNGLYLANTKNETVGGPFTIPAEYAPTICSFDGKMIECSIEDNQLKIKIIVAIEENKK